ncbi:unnamed protein product [Durusdinium trenchii]|uniref:ABC transporter domain-containing protein n=2 Tax=Durusdinium trenchii TaxID=1381693 RepID=A0ABP0LP41_9DINO
MKSLQILLVLELQGLQADAFCCSTAVSACRSLWRRSWQLLGHGKLPNLVCVNAGLQGASKWEDAIGLMALAQHKGLQTDPMTWSSILGKGSASPRTWVVSLQLLEACAQQLEPDIISLNAAIGASEGDAAWEFALTLMSTIFWRRLSPSRITFNSSIRACGTAQWTMAILLLRSMGGQQPDALSFNTAIAAAPWPIALQLLTEMETACLRASLATWGALISACEKGRQWQKALAFLRRLGKEEADVICYSAAISALEKGQQGHLAIELLDEMTLLQLEADAISRNAAISACARSGDWDMALSLLCGMQGAWSTISFNASMSNTAAWLWAVAVFGRMKRASVAGMQALDNFWKLLKKFMPKSLHAREMEADARVVLQRLWSYACVRTWQEEEEVEEDVNNLYPNGFTFDAAVEVCKAGAWGQTLFYDVEEPDIFHNIQVAKDGGFSDVAKLWPSWCARSGRLLALMGPSGAGKSLLLHSLAALAPANARVLGSVYWNDVAEVGVPQRNMALLEQEVPFFSELTVQETLIFAAQLEGLSFSRARDVAEKLLKRLRLLDVSDRRVGERYIGSSGQGLSGGEQRRLALACALAGEDEIGRIKALLADEPTTGLDTFQAAEMVELLAELGQSRRMATIMTIHQPRSSVWAMIKDVLLLGPGGRAVFCGSREDILQHLGSLGYTCPREGVNPADFVIDLVSMHSEGAEVQQDQARITRLAEAFALKRALSAESGGPGRGTPPLHLAPWVAFRLLLSRAWLQTSRDQATNLSRLFATGGLGLIFGAQFGFFPADDLTAASVTSRVALLSFGAISMAFIGEMRALDRFAKEKKVVSRERASGFYSGFTYLLAKAVAELPSDAMFACIFACVLHWRCGLRASLPELMAVYCFLAVVCAALGLAIGAAIPNAERAMTTGIPVMRPGWTAANCPTAQTATHQESNGCLLDDLPKDSAHAHRCH